MGDRLAGVNSGLERLEDVAPADHDHRVGATDEQRCDGVAADAVALVLEPMDLDQMRRELTAAAQTPQRLRNLLGSADEHIGEVDRRLHARLDGIQTEGVSNLLGVIDDVVECRRQAVAIAGVKRSARRAHCV